MESSIDAPSRTNRLSADVVSTFVESYVERYDLSCTSSDQRYRVNSVFYLGEGVQLVEIKKSDLRHLQSTFAPKVPMLFSFYRNSKVTFKIFVNALSECPLRAVSGMNWFWRIERTLKVSHVSVVNWVKKAGAKIEKVPKKDEKVEVLALDELCVNFQKTSGRGRPRYKNGLLTFRTALEK